MQIVLRLDPRRAPKLLHALVEIDMDEIKAANMVGKTPVLDGLRSGAIRYNRDDPDEYWKDWDAIRRDGEGDCEDLAPAVAAELILAGTKARPVAYQPLDGLWHVVVEYLDAAGQAHYGDPSVMGGMKGPA